MLPSTNYLHLGSFTKMAMSKHPASETASQGSLKDNDPYAGMVAFIQNSEAAYWCSKPALNVNKAIDGDSQVGFGPSWAALGPGDESLNVWPSADSGPETQPAQR